MCHATMTPILEEEKDNLSHLMTRILEEKHYISRYNDSDLRGKKSVTLQ